MLTYDTLEQLELDKLFYLKEEKNMNYVQISEYLTKI